LLRLLQAAAVLLIAFGLWQVAPPLAYRLMAAFTSNETQAAGLRPPGARIEVKPQDLPKPGATPSAYNSPRVVAPPAGMPLQAPPGFAVNVFASGFRHARNLHVLPNGDVLVAEPRAGRISILRDADADGVAEIKRVLVRGLKLPFGMAWDKGWLYVGEVEQVRRLKFEVGALDTAGPPEDVTESGSLGSSWGGHLTRNLVFAADGQSFFVAVGSQGNVDDEPEPYATIQQFDVSGKEQRTFASGLRNPVGLALHPQTKALWAVVNERDGLGDGLVPDYLAKIEAGAFFGWPYAYTGNIPDPDYGEERPDLVAQSRLPDLLFESHSAPIGLVFYQGAMFPPEYANDAFVALRGSWNSNRPVGYMVVRVPFADGRPKGYYEIFVAGFRVGGERTAEVWGRPAGLAVGKDGSLLIADDTSNTVFRVAYRR
jgi:glucose/arabinose dehydrogenase